MGKYWYLELDLFYRCLPPILEGLAKDTVDIFGGLTAIYYGHSYTIINLKTGGVERVEASRFLQVAWDWVREFLRPAGLRHYLPKADIECGILLDNRNEPGGTVTRQLTSTWADKSQKLRTLADERVLAEKSTGKKSRRPQDSLIGVVESEKYGKLKDSIFCYDLKTLVGEYKADLFEGSPTYNIIILFSA
ncbi:hypothetical protein QAD02_003205 [Eretmocerus hayati]|uniref:Uncharacterized protein n=1 Tax=Eretmocerus hayati TaxID=131215 RepID=A0ACC2NLF7_9HYME|nr:hypothetical protein QAD02_003205 [Eretmocerus hayati]